MIDTIAIVMIGYLNGNPCSPIAETYYTFDNSKGEYYCYVEKDEDILITEEWVKAHDEYWEKSITKIVEKKGDCDQDYKIYIRIFN